MKKPKARTRPRVAAPKKKTKKKAPARARKAAPRTVRPRSSELVEELEAALDELRRLSRELVSARRELLAEEGTTDGVIRSLRRELDTLRTELRTARADLEIAQANAQRAEVRLEVAAEAEANARTAQREAEHAADRARDEVLWLRREHDRLAGRAGDAPTSPGGAPSRDE